MLRELTCPLCGAKFESAGSRTIFCEACRKKAKRNRDQKARESKRKHVDDVAKKAVYYCDSQERINVCLRCTKPTCDYGTCEAVRSSPGKRENRRTIE